LTHDNSKVNSTKAAWSAPKLTKIDTILDIVQSGKGKANISNEGAAGGGTTEFRPNT